mmetsp:Transcript_11079/g.26886  ORF Transcript_11079/g.26886 Transcript_11079/m.26886 type:complete len:289 (+) Transcript_11079:125-991(+)
MMHNGDQMRGSVVYNDQSNLATDARGKQRHTAVSMLQQMSPGTWGPFGGSRTVSYNNAANVNFQGVDQPPAGGWDQPIGGGWDQPVGGGGGWAEQGADAGLGMPRVIPADAGQLATVGELEAGELEAVRGLQLGPLVPTIDPFVESIFLAKIYADNIPGLITMFANQLDHVKNEAQTILGLAGLAITVTGFSGGNVIKAGGIASGFLVGGICLIWISGVIAMWSITDIKWITEMLDPELNRMCHNVTTRRNRFQTNLIISTVFLGAGLFCYLAAVSIAAVRSSEELRP